MTKNEYRQFFANVQPFIKINYFLKQLKINHSNYCMFMKGDDWNRFLSIDKLDSLYKAINQEVNEKVV